MYRKIVFLEKIIKLQFSTCRDWNYSINTIQIAISILYSDYLMKKNKVGRRKENMYWGGAGKQKK